MPSSRKKSRDECCACITSKTLTNILLILIMSFSLAQLILKVTEDAEAAPIVREGMKHVRYFKELTEHGMQVMHNASDAVVTEERRRGADGIAPIDESVVEAAVVKEVLQLIINANRLMDRMEEEQAVHTASALLRTAKDAAASDGAVAIGRVLSDIMADFDDVFLQNKTAAHTNGTSESIATRIAHILEGVDGSVDRVVHGGVLDTANDTVFRVNGLVRDVEEAHILQTATAALRVTSDMLREVAASNVTGRGSALLDRAGAVLEEASESLEGMLHEGIKLSLGG
jgi:hypothetical protein